MYEYDDGEEGGRSTGRLIGAIVGVIVIVALGWFVVRPALSGEDDATDDSTAPTLTDASSRERATTTSSAQAATPTTIDRAEEVSSETDDVSTTADAAPTTTDAATPTAAPTTVAETTPPSVAATAAPSVPAEALPPYDTLPDGSPVPVIVRYDTDRVIVSGVVPDQESADYLYGLALAFAKPEQKDTLVPFLTVNPAVPRNVGVRVVELTSVRFPEGSAEVLPDQAREIDRLVAAMNAFPNVTTLVIGHADQRGDDATNYAISDQRARSVVNYLVSQGIAASRLSSRAVGEADLLSLADDDAALALNRRTEFIISGFLVQ